MINNKIIGQKGENIAKNYLIKHGYRIIESNFRTKIGEIDIIAKKNKLIVFVEVKTRSNLLFGCPYEAVDYRKQQKIIKTAQYYLLQNKHLSIQYRFDIIEVFANQNYRINHIENAFWL